MNKMKWLLGLIIVVGIGIILSSQNTKTLSGNNTTSKQGLKIGVILPLTGHVSAVGDQIRKAINLANQGKSMEFIFEDSANIPTKGVAAFNKLVNIDKVNAIIVAMSGISKVVAPLAKNYHIATFAISTSVPVVSSSEDFVVRYFIDGVAEAEEMAKYLVELGFKRIAVAKINDAYGSIMFDSFKTTLDKYNISPIYTESFDRKLKDFRASATKLVAAKPDCIYFIGYARPLAIAIRQTYEIGAHISFASTFGFEIPGTKKLAGKAAEGLIYTSVKFGQGIALSTKSQEFVKDFQDKFKQAPSNDAAFAYDLVLNIPHLHEIGALKNPAVLADKGISSQFGSITFNDKLEARVPIVIKKIVNDTVLIEK